MSANARADAPASGDRDWLIAAIALACTAASTVLLIVDPMRGEAAAAETKVVGTVSFSSADVRRRPAARLGWDNLSRGAAVHELDAVFVPPGVEAKVTFKDGTVLELDERSLVVIDPPKAGRRNVSVKQGSVEGSAGAAGLSIDTPRGTAQLSPQSQAIIDVSKDAVAMAVTKGDGALGDKALALGERGGMNESGVTAAGKWPVTLLAPNRNARTFFRGKAPPVTFTWSGAGPDSRVQLARDRGFAFVLEEHPGTEGKFTFTHGGAGVFWWRVLGDDDEPISESRRITVLEDVPPVLLTPRDGEVTLSDEKNVATFAWVALSGVSRYKLEISPSPAFTEVSWEKEVDGSQLRTALPLNEGRWYWRVRTIDEERGESGPSQPRAFRLIHRALPEAPELLSPEIEVEPAAQQK